MCVCLDVPAPAKEVGELVFVVCACAGLNFCHTKLGYWTEAAAQLGHSLPLTREDSYLWRKGR